MELTKYEKIFLNYYMNKYNAKWMRVFNNKHPFLETTISLYNVFKRELKKDVKTGQYTYSGMFNQLIEGEWYFIPSLLNYEKEES